MHYKSAKEISSLVSGTNMERFLLIVGRYWAFLKHSLKVPQMLCQK